MGLCACSIFVSVLIPFLIIAAFVYNSNNSSYYLPAYIYMLCVASGGTGMYGIVILTSAFFRNFLFAPSPEITEATAFSYDGSVLVPIR